MSCVHMLSRSHVQLFETLWTVAQLTPLSMGFFRQDHWKGLSFPPLGEPSCSGIEATSPGSLHWRWILLPTEPSGNPLYKLICLQN